MNATTTGRLTGRGHAPAGKKCHHLHEHRLSCAEYEDYRDRASGYCEICGVSEELVYNKLLYVDHCHTTGRIRGMLCPKCNTVMGCYDGERTWGANVAWAPEAERYDSMAALWGIYRRVLERDGADWREDIADHVRAVIAAAEDEQANAAPARAAGRGTDEG